MRYLRYNVQLCIYCKCLYCVVGLYHNTCMYVYHVIQVEKFVFFMFCCLQEENFVIVFIWWLTLKYLAGRLKTM